VGRAGAGCAGRACTGCAGRAAGAGAAAGLAGALAAGLDVLFWPTAHCGIDNSAALKSIHVVPSVVPVILSELITSSSPGRFRPLRGPIPEIANQNRIPYET
jgi:hypothetical protein